MFTKSFCLLVLALHYCGADTMNLQQTLRCTGTETNSVSDNNTLSPVVANTSSIFNLLNDHRTFSRFGCALLCEKYQNRDCAAISYDELNQNCHLYSWISPPTVFPPLTEITGEYCWKTEVFETTSSMLPSSTEMTITATSSPVQKPAGLDSCNGGSGLTTYSQQNSTSCPAISNCTCNKTLNVQQFSGFSRANDCFANCSKNPNCLAFSHVSSYCYIATATTHLSPLATSQGAFTCYCNKSTTPTITTLFTTTTITTTSSTTTSISSKNVRIGGVTYNNLSCYPLKLFPDTSYPTRIPIASGREADCRCEGGLYLENGAYVNRFAPTFEACYYACEFHWPCKAFSFNEADKTCIIAPTQSNGDSTDKGIIQCYT